MAETWRGFLEQLNRLMDAPQKRAFAKSLGVSQASINRWRRGEDLPNPRNLENLLTLLPEDQRVKMMVLMRADPKVLPLLPAEARTFEEATTIETLDTFCINLLRLQRDSPDRFWQLSGAILRKCLALLETHPQQTGMEIVVVTCMPPRDGKVRSLRALVGMGTAPWQNFLHEKDYFLGLNSLAGNVVVTRRGRAVSNLAHQPLAPSPFIEHEQSAAAFPIMNITEGPSPEMAVAGALVVSCTQPGYFTDERMELIEVFADLIRLALHEYIFYRAFQIDLVALPPWEQQKDILETFWEKFTVENAKTRREGEHSYAEIELLVRKQIEGELLQVATPPPMSTTHPQT